MYNLHLKRFQINCVTLVFFHLSKHSLGYMYTTKKNQTSFTKGVKRNAPEVVNGRVYIKILKNKTRKYT